MSDNIEEVTRRFDEDISGHYPRSIGLFPIPEYPELESQGMWSSALEFLLTTLRYLAPATILTLFWGQQSFFFTLLKHIDITFRSIVFSSEEQKQAVLQWLAEAGPTRVEHLDTVWKHGWILCGVLDSAMPGACAGHPHSRLSLKHAQAIADHYLGVEPVFSRQELETHDSLSRHQEWKLATYLDRVRQALSKITPPVSKPSSQRTSPEMTQFTLDYVAKGSGLAVAQLNYKMSFKIYPTAQQALEPGEVTILIRGPKDTYGMTVLPPVLGKAQKIRQKLLGLDIQKPYTENALPLTHGATYLRSYGKNDMNKTYYIPKTVYDIDIEVDKRPDHVKVWYTVTLEGKYEISITSRGQNIVGSPFRVTASNNIIGILEKENFCLEDGEEIDIVDVKTDRKVVLRIVDFVTEKMLLKENGELEKISEAEASILMSTDIENERSESVTEISDHVPNESNKFNEVANKIIKMNRVCKIFNELMEEKCAKIKQKEIFRTNRTGNDIPDIVNSTLTDTTLNPFILSEKRDKYIVPENITVSIRTERSKPVDKVELLHSFDDESEYLREPEEITFSTTPDSLERIPEEQIEDDSMSVDRLTPMGSNNPFVLDVSEDFSVEKKMGTFVKTEYERNNSQNEETRNTSIKIVVEETLSESPVTTNPFQHELQEIERPKTPVYKIISGEAVNRVDSPYLDPKNGQNDETLTNEFVNPFFTHQFQSNQHFDKPPVTNFKIGEPVSLPHVKAPLFNPEPDLGSLIRTVYEIESQIQQETCTDNVDNTSPLLYSTPKHGNKNDQPVSTSFHSLESNLTDTINDSNISVTGENELEEYNVETQPMRDYSPKKEIWDSAYVSIDDNNSSPDNNNNNDATMSEVFNKEKFSPSEGSYELNEDLSELGPAERELWQHCDVLNVNYKTQEDHRPYRWEIKRPLFTPIIEETDRSVSSAMKDSLKHTDIDSVSMAFAELNDVYEEYFPNSENSEGKIQENASVTTEADDTGVESASESLSDVTRHETEKEGTISEVQANVTESVSVSQPLRDTSRHPKRNNETKFCDANFNNIVLEKKRYWDEKIRQIEEKSEESAKQQKKRRFSAKQLKHDSLSKRKGKQIVKNFLNAGEEPKKQDKCAFKEPVKISPDEDEETQKQSGEKLVGKWKKYWDDKLVSEQKDLPEVTLASKSVKEISQSLERIQTESYIENRESDDKITKLPIKQELPEEEVFKAFETSPRRFFGTSRKRILNKIDSFLGKPTSSIENTSVAISGVSPDSGLVSSRISLFHKMTNTEPLPWTTQRSPSSHNITKHIEHSITSVETPIEDKDPENITKFETSEILNQINEQIKETPSIKPTISTSIEKETLQDKRARMMQRSFNQSFEEIDDKVKKPTAPKVTLSTTARAVDKLVNDKYKSPIFLRKSSISKSEMDIFNKVPEIDNGLDKHKSCDELPKINVKNFISLYENVSKNSIESKPVKKTNRPSSVDSQNHWQPISVNSDAEKKPEKPIFNRLQKSFSSSAVTSKDTIITGKLSEAVSIESVEIQSDDSDKEEKSKDKETTYISLSDIELEIVECSPDTESSPERTALPHIEYKNRFNKAKQFFQSLEELREIKKPRKLNECEMLLLNESTESLENERPQKRVKKKKTKSHSMPSSELAKYWNQMQEDQSKESNKLVKISEKFHVDDLFSDVMEGRLSRQGSLRGIPHKKAVLEAFRSMENLNDAKLTSYELTKSNTTDFTADRAKQPQSYLSEYPYLPTTDPSKSHSRVDPQASGLITLKELLEKNKMRRNSVPDLRLNARFSAEL